eukprot:CAMPEP_0198334760 /NCGR_PEP_ID=MMETSP1450-20131203/19835_1 /TAXON_ID=753684 ORGANISM="Madagascaria erythrocladiodes, Strain CCMP3234" /NCGR_SAMPLE_ID=MMETSP1450 /ASSEMBLY_ACC=CAM_ASM_001115 /LENGTH=362 /DNA_ID=CAMNT_0044039373 /DNA_START=30 /DNA_END=1118 /DNA_ORIENTATION=+
MQAVEQRLGLPANYLAEDSPAASWLLTRPQRALLRLTPATLASAYLRSSRLLPPSPLSDPLPLDTSLSLPEFTLKNLTLGTTARAVPSPTADVHGFRAFVRATGTAAAPPDTGRGPGAVELGRWVFDREGVRVTSVSEVAPGTLFIATGTYVGRRLLRGVVVCNGAVLGEMRAESMQTHGAEALERLWRGTMSTRTFYEVDLLEMWGKGAADHQWKGPVTMEMDWERESERLRVYQTMLCVEAFAGRGVEYGVSDGEKLQCRWCGLKFTRRSSVIRHERQVHEGFDRLHCPECRKVFTQRTNLDRHMKSVHRAEKKFICDVCGKNFTRKTNMDRHREKHGPTAVISGEPEQNSDSVELALQS